MLCDGTSACANADVICPELYSCTVSCSGTSGCSNLDMTCSQFGECQIECDGSTNVCTGAAVACGEDNCTAVCEQGLDNPPEVSCLGPCDCNACIPD